MNKILFSFVVVFALISSPVSASETLIASGHENYPPFMWKEGNKIVGVGVELTSIIFAELGIAVEGKYVGPWARVQHEAKKGGVDVIVGIYKTDERLSFLNFPEESYASDPVVIFVNKGNTLQLKEWDDLSGRRGATAIGESFGKKFDIFAKDNLNILRVPNIAQTFKMMALDRLDYTIYGLYPGLIVIEKEGIANNFEHLVKPISAPLAYQAFSKESKFLKHLPYFNKRIIELKADGTIDRLIEKYIAFWGNKTRLRSQN